MPGVSNPSGMRCSYGAPPDQFIWPVSMEPARVTVAPVYDSSNRVVTSVKYTVNLRAIIYPDASRGDATSADQMSRIRDQLDKVGGELYVSGIGFGTGGDLIVNRLGGSVWDVEFGPHPRVTECEQVGNDLAWRVAWTCETVIPHCPTDRPASITRPLSWAYTVAWDVDERGLTTRTVSGHVTIALTRATPDSTQFNVSADMLREEVKNLPLPSGFRRIPGRAELSEDKRTLTFSLTDRQLPNQFAPPRGVVLVDARHEASNQGSYNFFYNVNTISAQYTAARDTPKSVAWDHFMELYESRVRAAKSQGQKALTMRFSVSESIYDTTSSFSVTYAIMGGGSKKGKRGRDRALKVTEEAVVTLPFRMGLWTVPPSSSWLAWKDSLLRGAFDCRGYAGMRHDGGGASDYLVDICQPPGRKLSALNPRARGGGVGSLGNDGGGDGGRSLSSGGGRTLSTGRLNFGGSDSARSRLIKVLGEEDEIDEEDSWFSYRLNLRIECHDENVPMKLMPGGAGADAAVKYRPKERDLDAAKGFLADDYARPRHSPLVIQKRAQPTYVAILEGEAVRAAHSITPPVITAVGGARATPWNRDGDDGFDQNLVSGMFVPVVAAGWKFTYVLDNAPVGAILPPEIPIHRGVGDDGVDGFTAE